MAVDTPQPDDEIGSTHSEWHRGEEPSAEAAPEGDESEEAQGPGDAEEGSGSDAGESDETGSGNQEGPAKATGKKAQKATTTRRTQKKSVVEEQSDDSGSDDYNDSESASESAVSAAKKTDDSGSDDYNDSESASESAVSAAKKNGGKRQAKGKTPNAADRYANSVESPTEGAATQPEEEEPESEIPEDGEQGAADQPTGQESMESNIADSASGKQAEDSGYVMTGVAAGAEGQERSGDETAADSEQGGYYTPQGAQPPQYSGQADTETQQPAGQGGYGFDSGTGSQYAEQPGSGTEYPPQPGAATGAQEPQSDMSGGYIGAPEDAKKGDYTGLTPAGAESEPKPEDQYSYNTLEEKSGKGRILLILLLAIVLIVVLVLLVPHIIGQKGSSNTTLKSTTVTTTINTGPSTTVYSPGSSVKPYDVDIINVDDIFNYTGPSTLGNGQSCGMASYSKYVSYNQVLNSSSNFLGSWIAISGSCSLTITGITVLTPGFKLTAVNPHLPITIPAKSNLYFSVNITTPPGAYSGPLTIVVHED